MAVRPSMIATCWTSAGDVAPLQRPDERSPVGIVERMDAVVATGWSGMGISQDDLREVKATMGFSELRKRLDDAGLLCEVEFLNDWWGTGPRRAASDDVRRLLLEAAAVLGATHIKIGTEFGGTLTSLDPFAQPLLELCDAAVEHGTRIAIEPMPFSMISSIPLGTELVRLVDHPACGLMVDSWHVFRAGTGLDELAACLTADLIFGVELDDAAAEPEGTLFEDTVNNRLVCGEGVFDLVGLVSTLVEIGYDGPWGCEIISREQRQLPVREGLDRALRTATAVVTEGIRAAG
ncbi:sugar phosphate isomerase/epimerase [Salmonella enterica subsp. enterica serovar Senftenberg]|nr:sugar phosphate isomerase/epimerase [Salmonella enterica subsp. enterica serovar Senftenberg]